MVGLLKRVSRNMLLKMVKILEWDIFNCILKLIVRYLNNSYIPIFKGF